MRTNRNHALGGSQPIRRRSLYGGVLVDTLLAIFIATIGTLACLSLTMASNVAQQSAVENNTAYNAARQILENTRVYKGALLSNGSYNQADILALGSVPQLASLTDPSVSMSIANWRTRVKQVKVTVSWTTNSATHMQKSQVLVGLLTAKGAAE